MDKDSIDICQKPDNVTIPYEKFLQIIKKIELYDEIVKIYEKAEHNRRICGIMSERVLIANTIVNNLKIRKEENINFFLSEKNYINLNRFAIIISKIHKLLSEISQLKSLYKYIKYNSIEKIVKNLKDEFDSTIQILNFPLKVNYNLRDNNDDDKRIKADIDDLNEVTC
jgi:hypothetical protein